MAPRGLEEKCWLIERLTFDTRVDRRYRLVVSTAAGELDELKWAATATHGNGRWSRKEFRRNVALWTFAQRTSTLFCWTLPTADWSVPL